MRRVPPAASARTADIAQPPQRWQAEEGPDVAPPPPSSEGCADPQGGGGHAAQSAARASAEKAETSDWLVRCLEGRVPRLDLAESAKDIQAAARAVASGSNSASTESIMTAIASGFGSRPLVQD
mmetsp:Transcript_14887/g.40799  ORF Transcript_14887/g.40799 Transcript_14887/m.40799 type:complete len:124 (+) Transcript_14887:778-1149(+)